MDSKRCGARGVDIITRELFRHSEAAEITAVGVGHYNGDNRVFLTNGEGGLINPRGACVPLALCTVFLLRKVTFRPGGNLRASDSSTRCHCQRSFEVAAHVVNVKTLVTDGIRIIAFDHFLHTKGAMIATVGVGHLHA